MEWVRVSKYDTGEPMKCDACQEMKSLGFFGNPATDAEVEWMERTLDLPVMFLCDSCAESRLGPDYMLKLMQKNVKEMEQLLNNLKLLYRRSKRIDE